MAETVHGEPRWPDPHGGLKKGSRNGSKNDLKIGVLGTNNAWMLTFPVCTGSGHNLSDSGGRQNRAFSAQTPTQAGGSARLLIKVESGKSTLNPGSKTVIFRPKPARLRPPIRKNFLHHVLVDGNTRKHRKWHFSDLIDGGVASHLRTVGRKCGANAQKGGFQE